MAKKKKGVKQDLSGFMPIILLTIGCLVFLLIVNTIIIMTNPSSVRITSIIRSSLYVEQGTGTEGGAPFPFGNKQKEPSYIDVHRDRLIVYPGGSLVPIGDLETPGNAFEKLMDNIAAKKDEEYIVLLVHPRAALIARRLKKSIKSKGIDIGYELFEDNRPVNYQEMRRTSGKE